MRQTKALFIFWIFLPQLCMIAYAKPGAYTLGSSEIICSGIDVKAEVSVDTLRPLASRLHLFERFNEIDTFLLKLHSDSLFRYAWYQDSIHVRRYDFTEKPDTTLLILQDFDNTFCFVHPYPGRVTSQFGFRRGRYHYGVDINLNTGDSVLNAFDGIVRISRYNRSYGHAVVVRHFNGLETLYAHLSRRLVAPGDYVRAGDILGYGGNTGRSFGSHLHFEVRYFGEPLNPNDIIDFENFRLHADSLFLSQIHFEHIAEARRAQYYTIRSGDTLSAIARRHGTTVNALCRLNNMTPTTILRIGRRIRVR